MSTIGTDSELFNEEQMTASYDSINAIDYHQEISLGSLRFTSYPAGHVLGAAMFLIEISGIRVLYTGDYSTEEDRHLIPARVPNWNEKPDVMICESTYGVQSLEPRVEKEERFTSIIGSKHSQTRRSSIDACICLGQGPRAFTDFGRALGEPS